MKYESAELNGRSCRSNKTRQLNLFDASDLTLDDEHLGTQIEN